jgi:predicted membrane protein
MEFWDSFFLLLSVTSFTLAACLVAYVIMGMIWHAEGTLIRRREKRKLMKVGELVRFDHSQLDYDLLKREYKDFHIGLITAHETKHGDMFPYNVKWFMNDGTTRDGFVSKDYIKRYEEQKKNE